jgi:3-methyladenine DNA glycosylase AlkC
MRTDREVGPGFGAGRGPAVAGVGFRLSRMYRPFHCCRPMPSASPSIVFASLAPGLRLPAAPRCIAKGSTLKALLDREAIECLAHNLHHAFPRFDRASFNQAAHAGIEPLAILQRGQHLARAMRAHLPPRYDEAIAVVLRSLTPPQSRTDELGLAVFFYLPHVCFVGSYGLDPEHNGGDDPFEVSLHAQYELTRRFTAEFSIRPFLIRWPERTLARLREWTRDPDPHVRRLCSEGTRPRLPWAPRIRAFMNDPRPVLPILDALKDDPDAYVRRSVANHLGDIAKDHPALVYELCERWLDAASPDRKWLIRHAVRLPAKKRIHAALRLRRLAAA